MTSYHRTVIKEIQDIYEHHFITPLIYGDTRVFGGQTNKGAMLIITDKKMEAVMKQLYADWKSLSYDHSHQEIKGFNQEKIRLKVYKFRDVLLDPLKIHKNNP